jgi:hypothetical protein
MGNPLFGTTILGSIVPYDTSDTYNTHFARYGNGGLRTVYDLNERNSISSDRREDLMMVAVQDNSFNDSSSGVAFYILDVNHTGSTSSSLLDNNNWSLLNFGYGADGWILPPPTQTVYRGNKGQRSYDDTYLYLCVENNVWKRVEVDFFVNSGTGGFSGGTSGIMFGDVPVWGSDQEWDYTVLVKDVDSIGTTSGKLLITFTNNSTKTLDLSQIFSSTSSYTNGDVPIWNTLQNKWIYNNTVEKIYSTSGYLNIVYTNNHSSSFKISSIDELSELKDVHINHATSGEILLYNGSKWVNELFGDILWTLPPPLTSTSAGVKGELSYDDNFVYVCIENNSWKRINIDYFVFTSSTSGGFHLPKGSMPVWNGSDYTTTFAVTNIISTIHGGAYGEMITYSNGTSFFIPFGTSSVDIVIDLASLTDVNVNVSSSSGIGNVLEWNGDKWINVAVSSATTAGNGLSVFNKEIILGGTLTRDTLITGGGHTLEIADSIIYFPVQIDQGLLLDPYEYHINELINNSETIYQYNNGTSNVGAYTYIYTSGLFKIFDGTANENVFFNGSSGGLKYGNDYSSLYIDRSLVDKGYVDSFLSASNGVVNIDNNLQLGGGLNQNTSINGNGYNFILGGSLMNKLNEFLVYAGTFTFTSQSYMSSFGSSITNNGSAILNAFNGANSATVNVGASNVVISAGNSTETSEVVITPNTITNRTKNGTYVINTVSNSTTTNDAELFTTNITSPKLFQFPNKSGTFALLSDIISSTSGAIFTTAGNGLTVQGMGVLELGGNLFKNTVINGSNFNLSLISNNGNINLKSEGSGNVILNNLTYPKTDSSSGYVLTTNGSGVLSLTNPSSMVYVQTISQVLNGDGFHSLSETSLLSSSSGNLGSNIFSGNSIGVGDTIKLKAKGFINCSTSGSFTFNVKLGSTILASRSSVIISNPKTNQLLDMEFEFTVRAIGSSGKIIGNGRMLISTGNVAIPTMAEFVMTSDATINTTTNQTFDFTVSWISGFTGNLNMTSSYIRKEKFN